MTPAKSPPTKSQPSINGRSWTALPAYALVFLMAVFPLVPSLFSAKVLLLVVTLVNIAILTVLTGEAGLHSATATWTYFMSAIGFLFVLEGFLKGMTGAAQEIQIYVIWPFIYCLLMAGIRTEKVLFGLSDTIVLATSCVAVYCVVYSLAAVHVISDVGFLKFIVVDSPERQYFASADGFVRVSYPGLNSLLFLVPFSLAILVTTGPYGCSGLHLRRLSMWAAVLLGPASILLSGRRALFLMTLLAPFFTLLFVSFQPKTERDANRKALIRVAALGVLVALLSIACLESFLGLKMSAVAHGFATAFVFSPTSEDKGALYRRSQFYALLGGWMENPVIGAGYGATASGSIRSQADPSRYELAYMALLYQTGLVGFAAYSAGIVWIYRMGLRVIRAGGHLSALMVASLVGTTSILIANATNPYFESFERMWPIFVPIALINFWLLSSARRNSLVASQHLEVFK